MNVISSVFHCNLYILISFWYLFTVLVYFFFNLNKFLPLFGDFRKIDKSKMGDKDGGRLETMKEFLRNMTSSSNFRTSMETVLGVLYTAQVSLS